MTPTAAVWSSRISLKRQGFSSTHCTKLPLTPTRMTTIPAGTDSHPDLADIKRNQILSTGFCEAGSAVSTRCKAEYPNRRGSGI